VFAIVVVDETAAQVTFSSEEQKERVDTVAAVLEKENMNVCGMRNEVAIAVHQTTTAEQ